MPTQRFGINLFLTPSLEPCKAHGAVLVVAEVRHRLLRAIEFAFAECRLRLGFVHAGWIDNLGWRRRSRRRIGLRRHARLSRFEQAAHERLMLIGLRSDAVTRT